MRDRKQEAAVGLNSLTAAVLLLDIRDSTLLIRRLGSRAYIQLLRQLFASAEPMIEHYGGKILQFTGDGLLAVFEESPEAHAAGTICTIAVNDALNTAERLADIACDMDVTVGIGLTYGAVTFGQVTASGQNAYTVIGEEVHRASRLESLTPMKGSQIAMSGPFAEALPQDRARPLTRRTLKGFAAPETIFAPRSRTDAHRRDPWPEDSQKSISHPR